MRVRTLTLPFVLTIAAGPGCKTGAGPSSTEPDGGAKVDPKKIQRRGDGSCFYYPYTSCDPDPTVSCNPPPAIDIECPPERER